LRLKELKNSIRYYYKMASIGIDLGTTNSCVGWWNPKTKKVEIIENTFGHKTIPSYVTFLKNGDVLVGEIAKRKHYRNPTTTIYESKRFIGRLFGDISSNQENYPFKIHDDQNRIRFLNNISPEQVAAHILLKLKKIAEEKINNVVENAVITVPAYFNFTQREATKDAARLAGLNVLRLINEPTAASMAYGLDNKKDCHILVFDLGGGTLDTSLLNIDDGIYEVISVNGDTRLGGADFDQLLMCYVMDQYKIAHSLDFPTDNVRLTKKLKEKCERAKKDLSATHRTSIELEINNTVWECVITREKFETLCDPLFVKCIEMVKQTLIEGNINVSQVHDVVLVGGSSRIPKIQFMLVKFFEGKPLCKDINPDECVAYGASLYASILGGNRDDNPICLVDVSPLSLGLETKGGMMTTLIPRHTLIPITKTKHFSCAEDNQASVTIKVFEGERVQTKDNRLLGEFEVTGIQPADRGVSKIEVIFEVDPDCILTIKAKNITKGTKEEYQSLLINMGSEERITEEEIEEMLQKRDQDMKFKVMMEAMNEFENYLYTVRDYLKKEIKWKMDDEGIKQLLEQITSELKFDEKCEEAEFYKKRQKEFIEFYMKPIFKQYNIIIK